MRRPAGDRADLQALREEVLVSRAPRAGSAGRPVTFRATDSECAAWKRAAAVEDCTTLSAWIVKALNARAEHLQKRRGR